MGLAHKENQAELLVTWLQSLPYEKVGKVYTDLMSDPQITDRDLAYIAPTRVNLDMTIEKWPKIKFLSTREHGIYN